MNIKKNIYIQIRESLQEEKRHMAIPQTGAAVIVTNEKGEILLLRKTNGNTWVIPGGVQELGEEFRTVAKRELLEETGIDYPKDKLVLIDIVTGEGRHKKYPNGDEVFNNTVLYLADKVKIENINITGYDYQDDGSGIYKTCQESNEFKWFDLKEIPENISDYDLISTYEKWVTNKKKR